MKNTLIIVISFLLLTSCSKKSTPGNKYLGGALCPANDPIGYHYRNYTGKGYSGYVRRVKLRFKERK